MVSPERILFIFKACRASFKLSTNFAIAEFNDPLAIFGHLWIMSHKNNGMTFLV